MNLHLGNNLDLLKKLNDNSIDSIVTDPPYGLSFMNKKWDHSVPSIEFWKECLRVLKPGGHVLSFGGTRTYHRMAVNIEDAGFEIRDQIMWLYGSGFPKSHNISKGIDKKLGTPQKTTYQPNYKNNDFGKGMGGGVTDTTTKPNHELAKQWDGFGTALKPANEPIVLARKPLSEKTIVANVLKWGTGAINIDGCRVETSGIDKSKHLAEGDRRQSSVDSGNVKIVAQKDIDLNEYAKEGRWPANIILDEQAALALDEQSGVLKNGELKEYKAKESQNLAMSGKNYEREFTKSTASIGGASRFFYCAKASKSERNRGLEGMPSKFMATMGDGIGEREHNPENKSAYNQNFHPTVKPIKLMEYLVKLITPPNGTVLDPFMGSGSTGVACKNLGFDFVGMELDPEYFNIAEKRIGIL